MAEQWIELKADSITAFDVQHILGQVDDDHWVVSACVDRIVDNIPAQRALLNLGLARSDSVIERCTSIIALSYEQQNDQHKDALLSHFENAPVDAQLCHLRSILLQRLDKLNTYVEMEMVFPKKSELTVDEEMEEWEDDPWADGNDRSPSEPMTQPKSPDLPPFPVSEFLSRDVLWSACELASLAALDSLQILMQRHASALLPARFKVLQCIPVHVRPSMHSNLFPSLNNVTNEETVLVQDSWRQQPDFVERSETQRVLRKLNKSFPEYADSEMIPFVPVERPLSASALSLWYKDRVDSIISNTGMIDVALELVQHAAAQGIPFLDELGEDLSLLSRLVYDAPQDQEMLEDWTLERWRSMDPMAVVNAYLACSTTATLAKDIQCLVMPYLYVLEARKERAGHPDPLLPTRILYDFILTTSLDNVAAIFEASKPTLLKAQRIIKDDEEMARLALACLYGNNSSDEWATMSTIFECLPAWDVSKDEDSNTHTVDTTVASLGQFVTPSTNQPPATPKDLLIFFKPLPFASLSRALDILDVHLESGEILSRWSVFVPLRWFLQSSGDINEQRALANRMARQAGGKDGGLNGIEDWEWLLGDMLKLTGNGDPVARGAFCLIPKEEIMKIFLSGLLCTGNFKFAKSMLSGPRSRLRLSSESVESVCLACSREFYDNASSGNCKTGDMKLAYDCLDVPKPSDSITREKEFIEATSRITSFNVLSSPGTPISPIEIRLTKDRLSLISSVLSNNSDAYKHTEVILELCYKLGYKEDLVAEVKVLAMLAETALQAEDFGRAYENVERMIMTVSTLRNASPLQVDDEKIREAVEVCWVVCFQLGRQSEFQDLSKKMSLLGHTLELCPPDKIHDVLTVWRKLEVEDTQQREEELRQRQNGDITNRSVHKVESGSSNVASSLRARLQDFNMLSPPLLNTPDAAALASRTFKSVAVNFSFSVGHHPQSNGEGGSLRSEGSRRTDMEDMSSQATRVLSKGIGWLIGADGDV